MRRPAEPTPLPSPPHQRGEGVSIPPPLRGRGPGGGACHVRHYDRDLVLRARQLRSGATSAENILWQKLRRKQINGRRFRRQQPIGPFVVDFYCPELTIAIELDGDSHGGKESQDKSRQEFLEAQGLAVLRFWNSDVWQNLDGVLQTIYSACGREPE